MPDSVVVSAPAKINIHLRVLGHRSDGFHDLESIFQKISLSDELTVSRIPERGEFRLESPFLELPPVNTVSRAVSLFRELSGIEDGVYIRLVKRIPDGAGLGGGSSDAASVLTALNTLFDTELPVRVLYDAACRIGSDVPFFLGGSAAVVSGRGEHVRSFSGRSDLYGVLIWPEVRSSTVEAFRLLDQSGSDRVQREGRFWPALDDLQGCYSGPVENWAFGNSFTDPVIAGFPVIGDVLEDIRRSGAVYAQMSGSGSAVYGLYKGETEAGQAYSRLAERWPVCHKFLLLAS